MKALNFSIALNILVFTLFASALAGCNTGSNSKNDLVTTSATSEIKGLVADSVIQYLINSAAHDFRDHEPPAAIDFRNVKVGYLIRPDNDQSYILCGEFLAQEKQEWEAFATIKTSGYEQYIGNLAYAFCQKTTFVPAAKTDLSFELKNKLAELRK